MNDILLFLSRWSEVWPLLIPLTIFLFLGNIDRKMNPVIIYIIGAFFLMLIANYPVYYPKGLPGWLRNNNIFYNTLSVFRTLLIGWYIINIPQLIIYKFARYIYFSFIAIVAVFFLIFQSPLEFSNHLYAIEGIVLMLLCITYFLGTILDDESQLIFSKPEFLICAGFSIFESINFFINLFLFELHRLVPKFGYTTILLSKYSNLILAILLGLALVQSYKKDKYLLNPVLNKSHGQ